MKLKARAVIISDDKLLLIRREKNDSVYYVFPGGSVESGENFEQACVRELVEELGVHITINNIFYEVLNHEEQVHEQFFIADITSGEIGTGLDKKFVPGEAASAGYSIVQVPLSEIASLDILPRSARDAILSRKK
jgi:8-oxo-dGTP pyrophosphatase MutT (NUDIX family)